MRIQRFFLPINSINSQQGKVIISQDALIEQIRAVLRLKPGDKILILDGQGKLYHCKLDKVSAQEITATINAVEVATGDPPVFITVALALLKKDKFEWALQKLTELGVGMVVPVISQHCVVQTNEQANNKQKRWQAIVKEASEQCERATIPDISMPVKLTEFLSNHCHKASPNELILICQERSNETFLLGLLAKMKESQTILQKITIIVGPEGGFALDEIEQATIAGAKTLSLGPRILRSETAAIVAVAQIMAMLESKC